MGIRKFKVLSGVYWIEVPEAGLSMLCGCPADSVKHLMRRGLIASIERDGKSYETGPNAILLSDVMIQNGSFANMAEFPVLQMLYRQGMIVPNHPGNTGRKPLLIGNKEQVSAQMHYIYRGNYGLVCEEEMVEAGATPKEAKEMMRLKLKFAFGKIKKTEELLDHMLLETAPIEIMNGVMIERLDVNRFVISYKEERVEIDLNLAPNERYEAPFPLGFYNVKREYFSIIHSGQGDGWDTNRPSMSSVLMFQGKIYLIDAGPNILYSLQALGIGVNEIEGIFHTHSHDDHFAGLTSLLQTDHKLKYYATPLVRASVTKKLSALFSFEEEHFFDYFEVQDLVAGEWNNIEGLEVKPIFSPHPVETNILFFRTLWEDGYRSYAHLADTTSFSVLEEMITDDENASGISRSFYEEIKRSYLDPVDLKKIDIGGGMIHGDAEDYRHDASDKIILAHTSGALSNEQKEIGSGAPFGIIDELIPDYQDFTMRTAFHILRSYFPQIEPYKVRILMNNPLRTFNPESILLKEGEHNESIYLILAGNVEMIQTKEKINNMLAAGALIGELSGLEGVAASHTYRALNYVQVLVLPRSLYFEFVKQNDLYRNIEELKAKRLFLHKTWLFGEAISDPVHNKIAGAMSLESYKDGEIITASKLGNIVMICRGEVERMIDHEVVEVLGEGDFFGEDIALFETPNIYMFQVRGEAQLYTIPSYVLMEVPIVRWKLFETFEKRKSLIKGHTNSSLMLFEWKDEWSIGVQRMDHQHKKIFELANIFIQAMELHEDMKTVAGTLEALIDFFYYHYHEEEELMRAYHYPEYESHKRAHKGILDRIGAFEEHFMQADFMVTEELIEEYKSLVMDHISDHDMAFGKYLNEKGIY